MEHVMLADPESVSCIDFSQEFASPSIVPKTTMTVMEAQDAHVLLQQFLHDVSVQFQKVPGSAIFLRYIKSSYQNDPVRSAVELFLFLFAVRYLLAPKYSTQKQNYVRLSDQVGDC
jgi:hypothetical protein